MLPCFFYHFLFFFWVVLLEMIVLNTMLEKVGSAGLAQKSAMVHFRLSFCRRRPFNYFLCCLILHRGHHCSASRDLQLILPTFSSSVTSYITSYHIKSWPLPRWSCTAILLCIMPYGKKENCQKYRNTQMEKYRKYRKDNGGQCRQGGIWLGGNQHYQTG